MLAKSTTKEILRKFTYGMLQNQKIKTSFLILRFKNLEFKLETDIAYSIGELI
jgi:hypothetical protein